MAPPPVSPRVGLKVRDLMMQMLSDPAGGYNATIAAWADQYNVQPFELDFSDGSRNVFLGDVDLEDIEKSEAVAPGTRMIVWTARKDNQNHANRQSFSLFSGFVEGKVMTKLSWPQSSALRDFQRLSELAGDAIISIFNREANQDFWNPYVAYNGDVIVTPSRILAIGEHWRQDLLSSLTFGVTVSE